jgi:imidazolonepropionase
LTLRGPPGPRRGSALSQLNIIDDGALLIEDGLIREVGSTRRIENLPDARKAREISAAGRVVMPGFVDCHTHLISGPPRLADERSGIMAGVAKDARMILGNIALVRDTTSRRLRVDAVTVLKQCLSHGTTTVEAKSGYGLNAGSELKILRVLSMLGDAPITVVPTFSAASVTAPEFDVRPREYIAWLRTDLLPTVHRRGLARFVDASCDRGSFSAAELRPLYDAARALGLPLKMNLAQYGASDGAALAAEYSFISFDHLDHLDSDGLAHVAESGAIATLAPAATFFLDSGPYAPARRLIQYGVPIALASSYSRVTSPNYNMQLVIFLACHQLHMTAAEAVCAATINSAHALKLGNRIGSLEAGKQADLIILRTGDYREIGHEFGINLVDVTIKQGAVVYDRSGVKWPVRS